MLLHILCQIVIQIFGPLGMFYPTTQRPLQMANIPQGPQNPSVANMSNVQNSHGPLIVQPQPVEMASNTQSLQVTQPPSTASMQPSEPRPQKRRNAALKIIDPNTGNEIDLNNTQALPVSYMLYQKNIFYL